MGKRLQVLLDDDEYKEIQTAARGQSRSVSEWVRQALRKARSDRPRATKESKLRAIAESGRHQYPTADLDDMLNEIEGSYNA